MSDEPTRALAISGSDLGVAPADRVVTYWSQAFPGGRWRAVRFVGGRPVLGAYAPPGGGPGDAEAVLRDRERLAAYERWRASLRPWIDLRDAFIEVAKPVVAAAMRLAEALAEAEQARSLATPSRRTALPPERRRPRRFH